MKLKIQYLDKAHIFVELSGVIRMVMSGVDDMLCRLKFRKLKPSKKWITIETDIEFINRECKDSDCELSGCKHACCYWVDVKPKMVILE